jgi:hypothetical protein
MKKCRKTKNTTGGQSSTPKWLTKAYFEVDDVDDDFRHGSDVFLTDEVMRK